MDWWTLYGQWMQIAASVAGHAGAMPDLTHSVKYEEVAGATKEGLTAKWQEWVQAAGTCADLQVHAHLCCFGKGAGSEKEVQSILYASAVEQSGQVPPGNAKGNTDWSLRRSAPKPEIKLTPGKGLQDLTCSVEELVDQVVKTNKVWRCARFGVACSSSLCCAKVPCGSQSPGLLHGNAGAAAAVPVTTPFVAWISS